LKPVRAEGGSTPCAPRLSHYDFFFIFTTTIIKPMTAIMPSHTTTAVFMSDTSFVPACAQCEAVVYPPGSARNWRDRSSSDRPVLATCIKLT